MMDRILKERFRECLRRVHGGQAVADSELRGLIRSFALGWCEALVEHGQYASARRCMERDVRPLLDESWLPDASWRWW